MGAPAEAEAVAVGRAVDNDRAVDDDRRGAKGKSRMGPVEIVFLSIMAIFGVVGIVRGYHRELGVTALLLVALFVTEFVPVYLGSYLNRLVGLVTDGTAAQIAVTTSLMWLVFLIVVAFISYQGETLTFPGAGNSPALGLLVGLLNGYLFAGSVWYFLMEAGYPGLHVVPPFSMLYDFLIKVLPPVVLNWQFLIIILALMLIIRVWK